MRTTAEPRTLAETRALAEPARVASVAGAPVGAGSPAAPHAAPAAAPVSLPLSAPVSVPLGVPVAQGAPSSRYRYGTAMGSVANQYSGHPNLFSGFGSDPGSLNPYVYVGNNPATLTDPTGQNPLLVARAVGAAGSVLVDVGINLATGMKVTGSQVLQSAGSGCVGGLVGFGAGKVAGQVVAKLFSSAGPEARALASQAAACLANSFTPETRVLTETGERPIGEVAIGERVWAWDEQTGVSGWRTVTATIQSSDPAVVVLRIAGQELRATPQHPFSARQTDEDGWSWIAAGQLRVGDRVRTSSGAAATVEGVRVEPGTWGVVNLEVEGAHTFFVSDAQVLVHNACANPSGLSEFAQQNVRALRRWARSNGWVRDPTANIERWGVPGSDGTFEWYLKVKAQPSANQGLQAGSYVPRFDARVSVSLKGSTYVNPFTGQRGNGRVPDLLEK